MRMHILPASTGITWVKLGVKTFFKQPLALGGLFFMFMAGTIFLSVIPLIGSLLGLVLIPASTLGLMVATLDALRGKFPMPSTLFTAFRAGRERLRNMLILGVCYALALTLLMLLVVAVGGDVLEKLDMRDPQKMREAMEDAQFQTALLLGLAAYAVVSLLFWHAPALVHWYGVSPIKAIFFSAVACLRNLGAYTLYGMAWMAFFFVTGSLVSTLLGLVGLISLAPAILTAFGLSMAAMISTSVYFTFRDSFVHTPESPAELHPPTS